MDLKNFSSTINQIMEEKGISFDKVIESIETAIAAAYKKEYGKKGQIIKAKFDPQTGDVKFWQVWLVVSPEMLLSEEEIEKLKESKESEEALEKEGRVRFNPEKHMLLEDAKKTKKGVEAGEEIEIPLEEKQDYGRIAAQTAKQVILQKIREAEKEAVFGEYKSKEGEIVSGAVQRIEGRNVFIDIGKTLAVLPKEEQVYGEFYRPGQRLKAYILKVDETPRGPVVLLSRAYPKFVSKLFELEVPEISQGTVVIRAIAREAGSRSKIAVESKMEGVDPIGSAVGQRGTRVMAVIGELGGEKVDIIEYSDDPAKFLSNALSPAKVIEVKILPRNKAVCFVPTDQLSLAIGKEGQNVRLAAKLTGWKIDVKEPGTEVTVEDEGEAEEGAVKPVEQGEAKEEVVTGDSPKEEKKPKEKKVKKSIKKEEKK
jgi:transcription termination/antitermination protein NusA